MGVAAARRQQHRPGRQIEVSWSVAGPATGPGRRRARRPRPPPGSAAPSRRRPRCADRVVRPPEGPGEQLRPQADAEHRRRALRARPERARPPARKECAASSKAPIGPPITTRPATSSTSGSGSSGSSRTTRSATPRSASAVAIAAGCSKPTCCRHQHAALTPRCPTPAATPRPRRRRTFHWSTGSRRSRSPARSPSPSRSARTAPTSGRAAWRAAAPAGRRRRHLAVTAAAPGYALPDVPSVTDVADAYCLLPGAQIDASNGICGRFVVRSANAPAGAASFC